MIKYPLTYNPILEYWEQIESGKVTVCKKTRATYKKLANDIINPHGEYFYSAERGNHIIEFAENFCHFSKGSNKRVTLELWEKAMLAAIFGFINDDGVRQYQRAGLIVGKKNGKSLLASIVGLYMLVADGEPGSDVYAVATKKDQAKIIWQESKRMVKRSPSLLKRIKPLAYELSSEDFNGGTFKPLASDSDTLDGLNVHCVLMDEIHQWKNGFELYNIMADGITAREQPLIFITTTAGTIREDVYDWIYDDAKKIINGYEDENGYKDERSIFFIYELDKRAEWTDEKCWQKANPGLGTIKNMRTLSEKVNRAKNDSSLVKNLVCKEFDIPETNSEAWLSFETLNNTATHDIEKLKPRYGIGGADLSSTTDLTAAKMLYMLPGDKTIYCESMYWLPEDLLEKRSREDNIPYDKWLEKGYLRTTPGNKVHHKYVTEWFEELQNKYDVYLYALGYDSWSATYWVEEMKEKFGKEVLIPVQQGKKTLSSPMKQLGADLDKKTINYNNNPIDKWCLANTAYEEDKNGNIQPHKTSRATRRIDGTAALLDAYVILQDKMTEYQNAICR